MSSFGYVEEYTEQFKKVLNTLSSTQSDRDTFISLHIKYEDQKIELSCKLLVKLISFIGVKIIDLSHITQMFKVFVRRELTYDETNYMSYFVERINMNYWLPDGETVIELYNEEQPSKQPVALVKVNKLSSILSIKCQVRKFNAYYRQCNLDFFQMGKEITTNFALKKISCYQIKICSVDPKHQRDLDLDLDSRLKHAQLLRYSKNLNSPNMGYSAPIEKVEQSVSVHLSQLRITGKLIVLETHVTNYAANQREKCMTIHLDHQKKRAERGHIT